MRGDNRGTSGNLSPDSYRVRVNLNFDNRSESDILAAHSHAALTGTDLGKGHDRGSSITWSGNTAIVQITNRCGACPQKSPSIHATLTLTRNSDGSLSVRGVAGAFPALEIYAYGPNGKVTKVFSNDEEGGGAIGAIDGLSFTNVDLVVDTTPKVPR
jgi:hypothetical protein